MLQSISPYELLRQSKPQQPFQMTTDYDRFSIGQTIPVEQSDVSSDCIAAAKEQTMPKERPAKRTHYIADIHARHSSAFRHTLQSPPNL